MNEANICYNDVAVHLLPVTANDFTVYPGRHISVCELICFPFMYSEHLRLVARGSFPLDYSYLCYRMVRKLPCTFIIVGSLCYMTVVLLHFIATGNILGLCRLSNCIIRRRYTGPL